MTAQRNTAQDRPRRLFSRFYARISQRLEREGLAELRRELLAGLDGRVAEIGAGVVAVGWLVTGVRR